MIELKEHSIDKIYDIYPDIFKSVFGEWTVEGNCPAQVYFAYEDDNFVGFVSGYPTSSITWFMQRMGFIRALQKRHINFKDCTEAINILHNKWRFITTAIKNDDFPVLKMSMAVGFKINGVKQDTVGNLWVHLIHSKEE